MFGVALTTPLLAETCNTPIGSPVPTGCVIQYGYKRYDSKPDCMDCVPRGERCYEYWQTEAPSGGAPSLRHMTYNDGVKYFGVGPAPKPPWWWPFGSLSPDTGRLCYIYSEGNKHSETVSNDMTVIRGSLSELNPFLGKKSGGVLPK